MLSFCRTAALLAISAGLPAGRLPLDEALRRVAEGACRAIAIAPVDAAALAACMADFGHEVIYDDAKDCGRYGVLAAKLPSCEAAVARWKVLEQGDNAADAFVALIRAHSRCAGERLCPPVRAARP